MEAETRRTEALRSPATAATDGAATAGAKPIIPSALRLSLSSSLLVWLGGDGRHGDSARWPAGTAALRWEGSNAPGECSCYVGERLEAAVLLLDGARVA
ncbi:hypothetical protein Droror1_Dr00015908 [Drosera rotundifolia]